MRWHYFLFIIVLLVVTVSVLAAPPGAPSSPTPPGVVCVESNGGIEICDGLNNDCVGVADEGCDDDGDSFLDSAMNCAAGFTCDDCNDNDASISPSAAELCDNVDNDCDELVDAADSDLGSMVADKFEGVCVDQTQTCVGGEWQEPNYWIIPGYEGDNEISCDAFDNDCDGTTNEGINISTTCGFGVCFNDDGLSICGPDGEWSDCVPLDFSIPEECDGLDNDCDGLNDTVDPDLYLAPFADKNISVCDGARKVCVLDLGWQNPVYSDLFVDYEAPELSCDGLDNDCDGFTDDEDDDTDCVCTEGETRDTVCGVGACASTGIKTCTADGVWAGDTCVNGTPSQELCDGDDNDCDNLTDVNDPDLFLPLAAEQDGVCFNAVQVCSGGSLSEPTAADLVASIFDYEEFETSCDGLDNDCDGFADYNDSDLVIPNADRTSGVCVGALKNCTDAGYQEPDYASFFVNFEDVETSCDAFNNDCDEATDENCDCPQGTNRNCTGSDVGECVAGIQSCIDGFWDEVCVGFVGSIEEECNGLDDDCDNDVDEGLAFRATACGLGICSGNVGTEQCINASWINNTCDAFSNMSASEICGDGLDNNCNGQTDAADIACYVAPPSDDNVDGGSSGGSSGGSFYPSSSTTEDVVEEIIPQIITDVGLNWTYNNSVATVVITEPTFSIKRMLGNIPFGDFMKNSSLKIIDDEPLLVPYPDDFVLYHSFDFDVVEEVIFEGLKIYFRVTDVWLEENGVSRDEIIILYPFDGRWRSTKAKYVEESLLHHAELINFPLKGLAIGKGVVDVPLPVTVVEDFVDEVVDVLPEVVPSPFDKFKPYTLPALIIVVLGGLFAFAFVKKDELFASSLGSAVHDLFHHGSPVHQEVVKQHEAFVEQSKSSPVLSVEKKPVSQSIVQTVSTHVTSDSVNKPVTDIVQKPTFQTLIIKVDAYIAKKRSLGIADEQIRQSLIGAGWKQEIVDERLRK